MSILIVLILLAVASIINKKELFSTEQLSTKFLPVSGSENHYTPELWNDPRYIKTNNCYAYLLNDRKSRPKKPQPGSYAGIKTKDPYTSCIHTFSRVKKDNPKVYQSSASDKCRPGYYKGYLVLDPGKDYHFYRQDSTGYWSHKPGKNPATNVDAGSNTITNPRHANRIYKEFQYTKNCNFMCVPNDHTFETNAK